MYLSPRHAIRPLIKVGAIAASVTLIGCGGSEDSADEAEASIDDARVEFAECMRENGVDVPDPDPGQEGGFFFGPDSGIDPSSETFQAAEEECRPILEEAIPEGERADPAEIQDAAYEMTECLRDRGYDVPEPQIVTPGSPPPENPGRGEFREDLERLQDDPEFEQAQEECAEQADLPAGGGGPGGPQASEDDDG